MNGSRQRWLGEGKVALGVIAAAVVEGVILWETRWGVRAAILTPPDETEGEPPAVKEH